MKNKFESNRTLVHFLIDMTKIFLAFKFKCNNVLGYITQQFSPTSFDQFMNRNEVTPDLFQNVVLAFFRCFDEKMNLN